MTDDHEGHPLVLTTSHVMDDGLPVLRVVHDQDGDVQALDDVHPPRVANGRLVCLHHLFERDASLEPLLAELPVGSVAVRTRPGAGWTTSVLPRPKPWRLGELLPELAAVLQDAPLAAAARYAREVAAQCVDAVGGPRLVALAAAARDVPVGDSPERDDLAELLRELDDGDPEPGTPTFRQARAASALWFSLSDDPYQAAAEAAFEAHWCGLDDEQLLAPTAAW